MKDYKKVVENIRNLTKEYIVKSNLKSLVLGVSGGIDSALVAVLLKPVCDELQIPLIGRSISIETNKKDEVERSIEIGESFCTNFKHIDLTNEYFALKNMVTERKWNDDDIENPYREDDPRGNVFIEDTETELQTKIRLGNIKARIRMIYLYDLAQKNRGLVLSTDNLTELQLSFFTLHGDHYDFGCIQSLWKTEVYELSRWLFDNELKDEREKKALLGCVIANPTDGLGITNSDLDQLGAKSYEEVDIVLQKFLETGEITNEKVIDRHLRGEFKRLWPINLSREQILKQ